MTPLGVLDLVPISSGSMAPDALRNSIDLARQTERLGYRRYWFAEHHLNPGVAGTSPAVVIALTAAATTRIRLGSGAVQLGHRTALSTVEEFGLLDALHPGRIDLGLGRSGGRPPLPPSGAPATSRTVDGLLLPPRFERSGTVARATSHPGGRLHTPPTACEVGLRGAKSLPLDAYTRHADRLSPRRQQAAPWMARRAEVRSRGVTS